MEETRHERYLREKANYTISYRGIKLNEIEVYYFWHLCNGLTIENAKRLLIMFTKYDLEHFLQFDDEKHKILSTFAGTRKDNKAEYDYVYKQIEDIASYNLLANCPRKYCLSWNIIRVLFLMLPCFIKSSLTFSQKIFLYVHFVQVCNTIDSFLSRDWSGVKTYLCMFNAQDYESMITQFFRTHNVPTYSLDEGVHFIYKKNTPVDATQYENIQTDNLLCWGQFTKDEYVSYGISPNRIKVAGYPLKVESKPFVKKDSFKRIMILMARSIYDDANFNLLRALKEYCSEFVFCIKLHPTCDFLKYQEFAINNKMSIIDKSITLQECLNNKEYDVAIAVNTTAYYESLILGLPCLRFADVSFDLMAGYDDVFTDGKSFIQKIRLIESMDIDTYSHSIHEMLVYTIGWGLNAYKNLLVGKL